MRYQTVRFGTTVRAVLCALTFASCGGDATNPVTGSVRNRAPEVREVSVSPAEMNAGGTATVRVSAMDPDDDPVSFYYRATHGQVSIPDPRQPHMAIYSNDGTGSDDTIVVTVTDSRNASASGQANVTLRPTTGRSHPTPTPSPTDPSSSPAPGPTPQAPPTPGPSPTPTAPPPSPNPSPTPTPAPSPTPPPNQAPTVSILGGGSCHPAAPGQSCSVALQATASDPNGDPISFSWSGCASGSSQSASCVVGGLGAHTATVTVSDGRGGQTSASKSITGTNQTPTVASADWQPREPLQRQTEATLDFYINDDDQTPSACRVVRVYRNCTFSSFECSGTNGTVYVLTGNTAGLCTAVFEWTDRWGATVRGDSSVYVQ